MSSKNKTSKGAVLEIEAFQVRKVTVDNVKRITCFVRGMEIQDKLTNHTDTNVRDPNLKTDIGKTLVEEFRTNKDFMWKNQGITCVAGNVKILGDNSNKYKRTLHIHFGPGGGLINGGHTYAAICKALSDLPKGYESARKHMVALEIITGMDQIQISEMIEGRNTSLQVTPYDFSNLQGRWDSIKKNSLYEELISFKSNEKGSGGNVKPVGIELVLKILLCCMPDQDGRRNNWTMRKTGINQYFSKHPEVLENFDTILDGCLELYDEIRANFRNARIDRFDEIDIPGIFRKDIHITRNIPDHFVFAIMQGISTAVETRKSGKFKFSSKFKKDEFFKSQSWKDICSDILNETRVYKTQPAKIMKQSMLLKSIAQSVELWLRTARLAS